MKSQAEREAIPDSQKRPITNPDKYSFPVGINEAEEFVILCPYCRGVIKESTVFCPHCKKDTRNDAPFEEIKKGDGSKRS